MHVGRLAFTYVYIYNIIYVIQGNFEVKLPTIWTDEKQRWESQRREEKRKRREEERRSKKRKSQKKEDPGARKGRKSRKPCVFPMICGSGGSKSRLPKAAGADALPAAGAAGPFLCGQAGTHSRKLRLCFFARRTLVSASLISLLLWRALLANSTSFWRFSCWAGCATGTRFFLLSRSLSSPVQEWDLGLGEPSLKERFQPQPRKSEPCRPVELYLPHPLLR